MQGLETCFRRLEQTQTSLPVTREVAQLCGGPRVAGRHEVQRGRQLVAAQEPEGGPPGLAAL